MKIAKRKERQEQEQEQAGAGSRSKREQEEEKGRGLGTKGRKKEREEASKWKESGPPILISSVYDEVRIEVHQAVESDEERLKSASNMRMDHSLCPPPPPSITNPSLSANPSLAFPLSDSLEEVPFDS